MKRLRCRIATVLAFLPLAGCTSFFPQTSEAIAPATLDDLIFGFFADIDGWLAWVGLMIP